MKKTTTAFLGALVLLGASVRASGPLTGPAGTEAGSKAFINVRVFDGEKVVPAAIVVIERGRVTAVGTEAAVPAGAEIIDGAGRTLLPGLIDSHVHIWDESGLREAAVFGVTVLVDMFTSTEFVAAQKKAQAAGFRPMAHLVSSGILATAPGGHGTEYGVKVTPLTAPVEAQAWVDARLAEGSDFIKIICDDGSTYGRAIPTISRETAAALIAATRARGRKTVVHAATLRQCREALEDGADGLAHLHFDDAFDPDFGRLAASRKAFVIPTLTVLAAMNGSPDPAGVASDAALSPYLRPEDLQMLGQTMSFRSAPGAYAASERTLRELRDAGVPTPAGTDTANPGTAFGAALHGELALLVKAGLTPLEALRSATSVPADIFGLEGRGRIAPGGRADLLLVEGDPTVDIKATRAIVGVWKDGRRIDRESWRNAAAEARRARENQRNAPAPEGLGDGLISDFEDGAVSARFGAGWTASTDSLMGGKSRVELSPVDGGAEGGSRALKIRGEISETGPIRWASALFSPGRAPFTPANLSSKKALSFRARGEGKTFAVMVYAQSFGFIPKVAIFPAGLEWKEIVLPFEKFGLEGFDIMGIAIGATATPGPFWLEIDDVRLK